MDQSYANIPMVGPVGKDGPDPEGTLSTFFNRCRTEATTVRDQFTAVHTNCINLYLYGTDSPDQGAHVFPKIQGMIDGFLEQATQNMPIVSIEPITQTDGGPLVMTTSGDPVTLDGDMLAEYFQKIYDAMWQRSRGSRWYRLMAFYGKLLGWQDSLSEWDPVAKCPLRRIIPAQQWYKDPMWEDLGEMAYVGLDWPIDAQEAKREYPELAEQIENAEKRSIYQAPSATGYSNLYYNQYFARTMVTLSFLWMRNRKAFMTEEEALREGMVQQSGGIPNADPGSEIQGGDVLSAAPQSATQAPAITYILTATGEATSVNAPNWPQKFVLSQSIQIMNKVVSDEICPSWDIPVVTNFNIQIPRLPYGQSDCIRVRSIQIDRNSMHASIVKNALYAGYPSAVWPKSMKDEMPEEMRNIGMQPNKIYFIDDETLKVIAPYIKPIDPPPLPPSLITAAQELDSAFNYAGGQTDVAQGNAPTANSSAELASTLLAQAQSQASYSFQYLEEMLYRSAKLDLCNFLKYLTPQDLMAINRAFDLPTTALILQTAQGMEFDIMIEPGGQKQQQDSQLRQDFQLGLVDEETAQDKLGYDSKIIRERKAATLAAQSPDQQLNDKEDSAAPARKGSPPHKLKLSQPA